MRGVVYDGNSARAHSVEAATDEAGLTITAADGTIERISRAQLRCGDRRTGTLHRVDRPDWRFVAGDPLPPWAMRLPDTGALSPTARRWYAAVVALAIVVAAGVAWFGDDLLAQAEPLLPARLTRPIGDAAIAALNAPRCTDPAGAVALDHLVARLRPAAGFVEPVEVTVIDTPAVNAVTAPGGRIAVFRGLIDRAAGPDEVAGVLAHELTHVALRHPARALLRQIGVSLIVRALGGDVGSAVDTAGLLQSSRRAERAADTGALALLRAAHISPAGLAAFFIRTDADDRRRPRDGIARAVDLAASYTATHPAERDRAALVAAVLPQGPVTPALDAADWASLRTICRRTAMGA